MGNFVGYRNGKVKYMSIRAKTPESPVAPAATLDPVRELWEDFKEAQSSLAPSSVADFS
jgi:hypothetical protein